MTATALRNRASDDVHVRVRLAHADAGAANGAANGSDYDVGRVEYDVASALIIYEEYHPFGTSAYRAVDSTIEVSPKRYRYAAAERDEETGLDHMGLRYYAPWLGRWTSADPIGLGDGVNRYAYVHGNPVSMRDPGGTRTERPTAQEIGQYVEQAETHNIEVQTWHAEYASFDPEGPYAESEWAGLESRAEGLVEREGQLWSRWADLTERTIRADMEEAAAQAQRYFENPVDRWTLSPEAMGGLQRATQFSLGVTIALTGGTAALVVGADFIQSGVLGTDTVMHGGTALVSEALGSSPREAQIHGEIAETVVPVSLGAVQLGRGVGGPVGGSGLATTTSGAPMDPARFARMKAAFERSGGIIDQSAEAVRYLDLRGAEGLTLNAQTILLRPNPSASAVFEEFIHVGQFRHGAVDTSSVLQLEIRAAERLIQNRNAWGIPRAETRQTIQRLRAMRSGQ